MRTQCAAGARLRLHKKGPGCYEPTNLGMGFISHRIRMYAIDGNICHLYIPNVSMYTTHGSYGYVFLRILDQPAHGDLGAHHGQSIPHDNLRHLDCAIVLDPVQKPDME